MDWLWSHCSSGHRIWTCKVVRLFFLPITNVRSNVIPGSPANSSVFMLVGDQNLSWEGLGNEASLDHDHEFGIRSILCIQETGSALVVKFCCCNVVQMSVMSSWIMMSHGIVCAYYDYPLHACTMMRPKQVCRALMNDNICFLDWILFLISVLLDILHGQSK